MRLFGGCAPAGCAHLESWSGFARGGSPGRLDILMCASLLGWRYHFGCLLGGVLHCSAALPFTDVPLLAGRKTRARAHTRGHQCAHPRAAGAALLVTFGISIGVTGSGTSHVLDWCCFLPVPVSCQSWFLCWCLWRLHWFCTGPVSLCSLTRGVQ